MREVSETAITGMYLIPEEMPEGIEPKMFFCVSIASFWWIALENVSLCFQFGKRVGLSISFYLWDWKPRTWIYSGWKMYCWLNLTLNVWSNQRYGAWIAAEYQCEES